MLMVPGQRQQSAHYCTAHPCISHMEPWWGGSYKAPRGCPRAPGSSSSTPAPDNYSGGSGAILPRCSDFIDRDIFFCCVHLVLFWKSKFVITLVIYVWIRMVWLEIPNSEITSGNLEAWFHADGWKVFFNLIEGMGWIQVNSRPRGEVAHGEKSPTGDLGHEWTWLRGELTQKWSRPKGELGQVLLSPQVKGTPSIPETYLSSSVAWGLNLRVGWWRQILKKCKFSNGDL